MPSTSPSHCSARWAQSAISDAADEALEQPQRAPRAARSSSPATLVDRDADARHAGTASGPSALSRGPRGAPTASSAAGRDGLELSPEGGVFCNEFLIPLALDRRLRHRGDLADCLGVLQVGIDRRDDDSRFDGDQVDSDQRDADPGVDDDALVEHPIENVDKTCAACCSFNGHRTLLVSNVSLRASRATSAAGADRRRVSDASRRSSARTCFFSSSFSADKRLLARRQMMIVLPPVEADLLRLVDRADQQPDPDRQQLDFGERHLDVAGHDEPFVQHPVENVDQPGRSPCPSVSDVGIGSVFYGTFRARIACDCVDEEADAYLSNGDATLIEQLRYANE